VNKGQFIRICDQQTIEDLEFDSIRKLLASYCFGESAREAMGNIRPFQLIEDAEQSLRETAELLHIRNEGISFPRLEFEELGREIKRLRLNNATLFLEGIIRIYQASVLSNELHEFFKKYDEEAVYLRAILVSSWHSTNVIDPIEKVLDKRFNVKDDASVGLMRIRQDISAKRNQVNRNFDRLMRKMSGLGYLGESNESFLNDRRVLSALSSFKRSVPGRIIGGSRSGHITYLEPQENIQLNMELDTLAYEEEKELEHIFAALSQVLRKELTLIESYQELLCELDKVQARVRLAQLMDARLPILHRHAELNLMQAFHPLLFLKNKELGLPTLPQSMSMDKLTRMLVISGPNAGGKSITLKTIGLLQIMAQSGLLIPVGKGSKIPWFNKILSDIGDNQSIENQLSTYSYKLKRMRLFLDEADSRSLLLLDEFGTGSDPDLGGALAEVFFEELYAKGSFGVITTHYSNIKLRAAELPEALNASMLFDTETLEPRFTLSIGQPGSSFTFEVAQMNGIPPEIIARAVKRLDVKKVEMDRLISSLQQDKASLAEERSEMNKAILEAKHAEKETQETREHFEQRLEVQQKRLERNNKYLSSGKKMSSFIDAYILSKPNKELMAEVKKFLTIEKTKLNDVQRARALKDQHESMLVAQGKRKKEKPTNHLEPIVLGSRVRLEKSNQRGEVIALDGKEVTVMFGMFKTKVDASKLVVV
jgi:DNA mismatch repair protein MutS2